MAKTKIEPSVIRVDLMGLADWAASVNNAFTVSVASQCEQGSVYQVARTLRQHSEALKSWAEVMDVLARATGSRSE